MTWLFDRAKKFREKIRYRLLCQTLLQKLGKLGIIVSPVVIFQEGMFDESGPVF